MSTAMSRKETERTKLIQEKCQTLLTQMLRDEDNKYCVDCDAKGPRWASWNIGVFLCIRCAGIHRNLGVHISRVKSVNLDTWTPEQVISLQQMGNSRARAVYEAQLPDGFRRPQTDTALESFIRAKYEHKKYLAREWVPPLPPKVDWAKEIDEELEKQKRKKKAAQANSALGLSVSGNSEKKPTQQAKTTPLPAPLPKPKHSQSSNSPKTQRTSISSIGDQSDDLLGLSSPTKPVQSTNPGSGQDIQSDSFSSFISATSGPIDDQKVEVNPNTENPQNSLAKEEQDFFNQGSLAGSSDKDKSGKLTKASIMALYGAAPANPIGNHNPQLSFGQPQPMFGVTGVPPNYLGGGSNPHPHSQQQQFMTPPNSASMYNSPVMTAPAAFSTPGLNMQMGAATGSGGFGGQFPVQSMNAAVSSGYTQQMSGIGMIPATNMNNMNLMQSNHNLLGGMSMMGGVSMNQVQTTMTVPIGGVPSVAATTATAFQKPGTNSTANLNQQFGNLNIGNVWQ